MREIFEKGRDWFEVLRVYHRQENAFRRKARFTLAPKPTVGSRVEGKMSVAEIETAGMLGHAERIFAWACSVSEHRF